MRVKFLFRKSFFLGMLALCACAGMPERGTPEWNKRVLSGDVLVVADDVPDTRLKIVKATGWTPLKPDVAWEIFQDINSMHTYLYRVIESRELQPQGGKRVIRLVVNAPPIALTSGYDKIDMTAEVTETIREDGSLRRGDFVSIRSNVKNAYGAWEIEPYMNGSLITFSMFIDFGKVYIPDDAANFFVKDFLVTWGKDLREWAEAPQNRVRLEQNAARRAGKDPNDVAPTLDGAMDFLR